MTIVPTADAARFVQIDVPGPDGPIPLFLDPKRVVAIEGLRDGSFAMHLPSGAIILPATLASTIFKSLGLALPKARKPRAPRVKQAAKPRPHIAVAAWRWLWARPE